MPEDIFPGFVKGVHDLTAPFFHYLRGHFDSGFIFANQENDPTEIRLESVCQQEIFGKVKGSLRFELQIRDGEVMKVARLDKEGWIAERIS